ncbi:amidase family protein [Petropleomorpha daqingensis]|uniref:Amidase n=1 Tax=Petropleomorpha daqingensis TaxID=2026353 RepID=A0A853CLY8_9ACTN|nr:amidase family protein [Petropleomorpha daqingensis]NYJ08587.1 amidase [Petropleomorpha daqingensis]
MTTSTRTASALDLAAAVRGGRRTAVDVVREHLDRIAARDPELNAFCTVRADAALADAAAVDASESRSELPLAGVPVAVKENIAVAGEPLRHGSAATSATPAAADDELVTRVRAAGCVVVGTTRMPELAAWGFTASAAGGPTRNPWDLARDPGGSTGGGAAAVAAGLAALALGTDGGGSLRIPGAACGLVGVKPTPGLVPLPGGLDEHWYGLTVAGPIARTAADAAAALAVLSGQPVAVPDPAPLHITVSTKSPSPLGRPDAHQRAAVEAAEVALSAAGHRVERGDPPYPATLLNQWGRSWLAGIAEEADRLGLDLPRLEPRTATMVRKGRRHGPRPAEAAAWRDRALDWFARTDVLLTPAVARVPGPAGALTGRGYLATYLASAKAVPFCQAWNLAGFPAVTVPVGVRDGLPLVVQLVGRPGSEALLLGVAAQLETTAQA